jgi:hypothetical protein
MPHLHTAAAKPPGVATKIYVTLECNKDCATEKQANYEYKCLHRYNACVNLRR